MSENNPPGDVSVDITGEIIAGKYQILDFIAKGGGGTIYRAIHKQIGRDVVLKILHPNAALFDGDPHFATRFRREASTYGRLRHPNTVTLFDYGEHAHQGHTLYFMALELVQGKTLRQVIRQSGRLAPERAVAIIEEVLRSLREAHKLGIVHRDLKPSNIMLAETEEGERVKVLDFGVAKVDDIVEDTSADAITRTGTVVGSPHYMAPEQVRSEKIDGRADIYALGCILFEMLSGQPPYGGAGIIEICAAHITKPIPTLASGGLPDAPAELEAIIRKCLAKEADQRYQSADELLTALKRLRSGSEPASIERSFVSLAPVQPALPEPPKPARTHPAIWIAIGAILATLPVIVLGSTALFGLLWMVPEGAEEGSGPSLAQTPEIPEPAPEIPTAPAAKPLASLHTEPPGAEVYCGKQRLGVTPLSLTEEPLDCDSLVLRLSGHQEERIALAALSAETEQHITMSRLQQRPKPAPAPETFKPDVRTER